MVVERTIYGWIYTVNTGGSGVVGVEVEVKVEQTTYRGTYDVGGGGTDNI